MSTGHHDQKLNTPRWARMTDSARQFLCKDHRDLVFQLREQIEIIVQVWILRPEVAAKDFLGRLNEASSIHKNGKVVKVQNAKITL